MNEATYKELCKLCDGVLIEQNQRLENVSIAWLHVIREHPVFLEKYKKKFFIFYLYKITSYCAKIAINIFRSIFQNDYLKFKRSLNHRNVEIIFISHLLNSKSVDLDDFYFGNLPDQFNSLVIKINHTEQYKESLKKNIILFPRLINFYGEIRISKNAVCEFLKLIVFSLKCTGKKRVIYLRAAIEALSPDTLFNLRLYYLTSDMLKIVKPKLVITTFEGHAWERIIFASANKNINSKIKSVGYQHAALFKMQHAIYRSLGSDYDPSFVLSAGEIGLNQMKKYSQLHTNLVGVLGSPRSTLGRKIQVNQNTNDLWTILVLPEGILSDCIDLFSFTLECAKLNPCLHFIWRNHPLINFEKVFSTSKKLLNNLPNVELSTNTFEFDLSRSSYALHRGSTAIISAVSYRIKPIYLNQLNKFPVNPLFEIEDQYPSVLTPEEFINVLPKLLPNQSIIEYCQSFYNPLSPSTLRWLVDSKS